MKYYTHSAEETINLAKQLSGKLTGGEVILLNGELGAGKTTFTKGLAEGFGSKATVVSPTFTIMHEYIDGRLPLYHFDMYRIMSEDDLYELGLEEYLYGDGVCVIEWNKFVRLPEKTYTVNLSSTGGDEREIEICGF